MIESPHDTTSERRAGRPARSLAEDVLDELLPERLDWRDLVVRNPLLSVAVAVAAGFWLGRQRGGELLGVASTMAGEHIDLTVSRLLEPQDR